MYKLFDNPLFKKSAINYTLFDNNIIICCWIKYYMLLDKIL